MIRNELEKYIVDLQSAIGDLDEQIEQVDRENGSLQAKTDQYSEQVHGLMLKLSTRHDN